MASRAFILIAGDRAWQVAEATDAAAFSNVAVPADADPREVAAEIAVNEITRRFQHEARNKLRRPSEFLVSAIQSAHRAIVSHAVEHNLLECPRTTCVTCIVQHGSAYWAHAGDSRLYHFRNGELRFQTRDDSVPQRLADAGEIQVATVAAEHDSVPRVWEVLGREPEVHGVPSDVVEREAGHDPRCARL